MPTVNPVLAEVPHINEKVGWEEYPYQPGRQTSSCTVTSFIMLLFYPLGKKTKQPQEITSSVKHFEHRRKMITWAAL